jgi:hypothetical protein
MVLCLAVAAGGHAAAVDGSRPASHGRHVGPNPGRLFFSEIIGWYDVTLPSQAFPFGQTATDTPLPGDWDGDGTTDAAVFRATKPGAFFIAGSHDGYYGVPFGQQGDDPAIVGDYDGDGRLDPAVYRPGSPGSTWYVAFSRGGFLAEMFGNDALGDQPVPGDYDGDRRTDLAVRRVNVDGNFDYFINGSRVGYFGFTFGRAGDAWVPGDFDGDGRADGVAIRRMGNNGLRWFFQLSSSGYKVIDFGRGAYCEFNPYPGVNRSFYADRPHAVGDLDGDRRDDIGVLRITNNDGWPDYMMLSKGGFTATSGPVGDPVDNLAYGHIDPIVDPCI